MAAPPLTRTLRMLPRPSVGTDVEGVGRMLHRYLRTGQLGAFDKQRELVKRTFGHAKVSLAKQAARKAGLPQHGVVGPALFAAMVKADANDSLADLLLTDYALTHTLPELVHPHPLGPPSSLCQDLHRTLGLVGNWALDFCCPGGTYVVAVEAATITKLSGRPPSWPPDNLAGIWGWSMHYRTPRGYAYFATHYGERMVRVGQRVKAGTPLIGRVGGWPGNPGRSHTHIGVTSPLGERDAKARMRAIANAPRVTLGSV
jgi:hypothetical protein